MSNSLDGGTPRCGCAPTSDPAVNLGGLELPQTADLVGGHALFGDPGVGGAFGDAEMNDSMCS